MCICVFTAGLLSGDIYYYDRINTILRTESPGLHCHKITTVVLLNPPVNSSAWDKSYEAMQQIFRRQDCFQILINKCY